MEVEHRLTCLPAAIVDESVTGRDPFLHSDTLGGDHHPPDQRRVLGLDVDYEKVRARSGYMR